MAFALSQAQEWFLPVLLLLLILSLITPQKPLRLPERIPRNFPFTTRKHPPRLLIK